MAQDDQSNEVRGPYLIDEEDKAFVTGMCGMKRIRLFTTRGQFADDAQVEEAAREFANKLNFEDDMYSQGYDK